MKLAECYYRDGRVQMHELPAPMLLNRVSKKSIFKVIEYLPNPSHESGGEASNLIVITRTFEYRNNRVDIFDNVIPVFYEV